MGYAEMLIDDAVLGGRGQFTDDLQRILDAGRSLHRLILSLLDPATIHRAMRTWPSSAGCFAMS